MTLADALRHYVACARGADAGFLGWQYVSAAALLVVEAELAAGVGRFYSFYNRRDYDRLADLARTGALLRIADDVEALTAQAAYNARGYRAIP